MRKDVRLHVCRPLRLKPVFIRPRKLARVVVGMSRVRQVDARQVSVVITAPVHWS